MRPTIGNIASKHFLNLSSTLFPTRTSLHTIHLLSAVRCHTSTASKTSQNASLSQAGAKARYEHVYTTFHEKHGYTSPTFKPFLADMARTAGYIVTEKDEVANPKRDGSDKNPILRGGAGHGKTLSKEDEREMESEEDGKVADDEVEIANRLVQQYLKRLEKNTIDFLERMRPVRDRKEEEREVNRWEEKNALDLVECVRVLRGGKKVCGKHDKMHEKMHDKKQDKKYEVIEYIWWDPDDETP